MYSLTFRTNFFTSPESLLIILYKHLETKVIVPATLPIIPIILYLHPVTLLIILFLASCSQSYRSCYVPFILYLHPVTIVDLTSCEFNDTNESFEENERFVESL